MSAEAVTAIIMFSAIGLFLLWRIPIGMRIKREEQEFIEQYSDDHAILIFYGYFIKIGDWVFYDDRNQYQTTSESTQYIEKIRSYYGKYTFAITPGEYDLIASFDFNYGNGTKIGGTGYTKRITKKLQLSKGCIYRYRLKDLSLISKKQPYKTLFQENVESTLSNYKFLHTITFEQLIN